MVLTIVRIICGCDAQIDEFGVTTHLWQFYEPLKGNEWKEHKWKKEKSGLNIRGIGNYVGKYRQKYMKCTVLMLIWSLLLCGCGMSEMVVEKDVGTSQEAMEQMVSPEQTASPEQMEARKYTESAEQVAVSEVTQSAQTSLKFVESMGYGWNLGNTLDPVDCTWVSGDLEYETAWGNVRTTKELIQFIKAEGFDTIRIPVTWTNHVGEAPDYIIREEWMDRVQEIVDWCVEEDVYIIINMHHESGWLTQASTDYDGTMQKYRSIWAQIADRFGNYSDKLIFESMNEIGFDDLDEEKGCELLNQINGEFVELIRNSGGKNGERYLLLAGYWADIDSSCQGSVLPEDERVILSVHYYSPSEFAIAEAGTAWGYANTWGTEADFAYLKSQMGLLKTCFIDKGIPVIMGEYGCIIKDKDSTSRVLYLSTVAQYCRAYGICPVLWDNGEEIDRSNLTWRTEGLKEAIFNDKE